MLRDDDIANNGIEIYKGMGCSAKLGGQYETFQGEIDCNNDCTTDDLLDLDLYCTCVEATKTDGDPVAYHNGTATQFSLEDNKPKAVLKQGPLTVFYRVANPLDAAHHTGADWITSVGVEVEGAHTKYINISVVGNPESLLAPDLTREPPLPGVPLTTMNISVGGKPLLAGDHTVEPMLIKATFDPRLQRVGQGYKERVDIITDSFHMRVNSAKAKKFKAQDMQIKALHLDVDFIKFEKTAVRGVLPELWGLVPISKETQKLIKPF